MNEEGLDSLKLMASLRERAKELNCLYRVDEILMSPEPLEKRLQAVAAAIPHGWQNPQLCQARIAHMGREYVSDGYRPGGPEISEELVINGNVVGSISVNYPRGFPGSDEAAAFLKEERQLLWTLAQRIGHTVLHESLSHMFHGQEAETVDWEGGSESWRTILEMLFVTDRKLHHTLCRRLLNYLSFIGVADARALLNKWVGQGAGGAPLDGDHSGVNQPMPRQHFEVSMSLVDEIFAIAGRELTNAQLLNLLQRWIGENRIEHLINVLDDHTSSLSDIMQAMDTHQGVVSEESSLSMPVLNALKVSLIRRLISRRLDYISRLKELVTIRDFYHLSRSLIFPAKSHGQLGGKGAGLFLAHQVLRHPGQEDPLLRNIRIPETWFVSSDGILDFVHYNRLEELLEYRYRYLGEIRLEYPNLIQLFKNCAFSPEMRQGLSMALDAIGDHPLIVRSSSLLEDSTEAAFSGKYKSLFLANQGTKQQRLEALLDAMAEVYASMFGPDPIEYRSERNLLDFQEEMGILIQQVVGTRVGRYFMPAYSGVAFSRNEFRWSSRIKRNDGLIRLVPGLGTRAVDRVGDDYPILAAPGQPGLRVNTSLDETIRYSPRFMDVINLENCQIETLPVEDIIREYGFEYPQVEKVFSVLRDGMMARVGRLTDFAGEHVVPTFEGLMSKESGFLTMMKNLMELLETRCGFPVDIEFAADAEGLYLLQCRAQSSWAGAEEEYVKERPLPEDILFTANRYVSDGFIREITHIVYVSPAEYDRLQKLEDLVEVGRTVGMLNSLLPKGRFVLMGPGRWGSRGDIKLGVKVTYSDINNSAALIEMAFRRGSYVPDLSFGTHFFQDLVEAGIHYLPLYPDDEGVVFDASFFENGANVLSQLLPECSALEGIVRVIDVPASTGGRVFRIAMNGDEGKAQGYIAAKDVRSAETQERKGPVREHAHATGTDDHWLWRQRMAELLAGSIDPDMYGVKGVYLFGSTKNATAGPCSDIDLLVHFEGDACQRDRLGSYLDGWDLCLGEMNYIRTGFRTEHLLDVHLISDEDIRTKQSYAVKIGLVGDSARPLELMRKEG